MIKMYGFYKAVEEIYEYKKNLMIIGLTGRTGSGCTTVSRILKSKTISDLDFKKPKSYDYKDSEERKIQVIYNFMKNENNWKDFFVIEGSAIILSFVMEKGFDLLIDYLDKNNSIGKCKLDNIELIKDELKSLEQTFNESKIYSFLEKENLEQSISEKNEEFYLFYIQKLPLHKKMLQDILSKHICYPSTKDDGKAQLYTYLMQTWGNNIRASGNPYGENFTQNNYFDIARRIDKIINIIVQHNKVKDNKSVRICIDALRNPYEAIYFKDNYKNFNLVSVSTDDKYRVNRLSFLSKKEQEALEATESPIKFSKTEEQFYHQNIQGCLEISNIHIYNPDVEDGKYYFLTQQIIKYIALILHPGLITPTHVERCMQLAYNAKFNSGCLSRQVGAIITGNDFSIRAVGWNDVPKGQVPCNLRSVEDYCENKDCESYSNFELCDSDFDLALQRIKYELKDKQKGGRTFSYCFKDVYNGYKETSNQVLTRSLHAEENAFLQISKYGGTGIKGGYLFTTASPCELCAKKAYQLGITNIYYIDPYPGISIKHILKFGKTGNPNMNLFYGAIGSAYIALYEPRMAMKDELELITGIKVKETVKKVDVAEESLIVSDVKFKSIELELCYNSNTDIHSIRKTNLEVMGEPINHIEKEIIWTGSKYKSSVLIENEDGYELEDSTRKTSPYKYKVLFNKSVMKGEQVSYTVKTSVSDEEKEMQPFLSHTVKNPTDRLVIVIKAPKEILKEVEAQEYRDSGREIKTGKGEEVIKIEHEEKVIYTYEVCNPKLLHTYCLQWKF